MTSSTGSMYGGQHVVLIHAENGGGRGRIIHAWVAGRIATDPLILETRLMTQMCGSKKALPDSRMLGDTSKGSLEAGYG